MIFTPSGPSIIATSSTTPQQFTEDQVEGVLAIINDSSVPGFISLDSLSGSQKNNVVPIPIGSALHYIAFGAPLDSIVASGAGSRLVCYPGYMNKVDKELSAVDLVSLEPVAFYFASIEHLFQDTAGTIPVVNDSTPVGFMRDISGNGNHLIQSTAASRPLYRTDGSIQWLEFDGVDDWMRATFAINQPWSRISAIRQLSYTNGDRIFGPALSVDRGFLFQSVLSPELSLFDGATACTNGDGAIGYDVVVTEIHNSSSSRLGINDNIYVAGNPSTNNNDGLTVAGDANSPDLAGNFRFYGMVMLNGVNDPQIAMSRRFMYQLYKEITL